MFIDHPTLRSDAADTAGRVNEGTGILEHYELLIDGHWLDTSQHLTVRDPGTGRPFATVAAADRSITRRAVEAAHSALPGWRALTGMQRGDYLLKTADLLAGRRDEIACDITRENGKPLPQSEAELAMAIDHIRWFAEEARRAYGRIVPHQVAGKRHLVLRQSVGVVAAISPWNFPLVLAARKVSPALAAGCPVILKPSSKTPLCAIKLAQCFVEAGIPNGVFQLIAGEAQPIAQEFSQNPLCAMISFTGSTKVGKQLIASSASTVTRLSLELGGHAPLLVFADADPDQAIEGALVTKFRNTGQSCIAAGRIYVERSIYHQFLERFVTRARSLKVGYGLERGVDIGALVNKQALATALRHIKDAVVRGGRLLCGGKALAGKGGHFLEPTVIADVPPEALCMYEETFAPVAAVIPFDSEAEAVAAANNTRYGLAAYAFTGSLNRAFRLMEALEAGTVCINDAVPATSNCPFGGMKESGVGRELGTEGLDAFLETKHVSIAGIG